MVRKMFAVSAAVLLALLFFAGSGQRLYADEGDCGYLIDCQFDKFYEPEGACSGVWKCFTISPQRPGISLADHEGRPRVPSVMFRSTNLAYDSGLYQQVAVTPGKGYTASLHWAVERINAVAYQDGYQINRKVGIDPFGGTDPNSPNIKWSNDYFDSGKFAAEEIRVDEYARADTITVFLRVINPYGDKVVEVYLDSPALFDNNDMAPIQVSAPTVTPPPPPPTDPPPPPEPTIVPPPTDVLPTDVPPTEVPPTEESVIEPTATVSEQVQAPPATQERLAQAQPTSRPSRTRVAAAQRSASNASGLNDSQTSAITLGVVGVLGLVGISGAILMVSAAAFMLLRRK
ncbi:MAG: hypothetical protein IT331_03720 [Anaerolineae bacterium]|nr:hypothetical protein [Anaerolineae bacterium]